MKTKLTIPAFLLLFFLISGCGGEGNPGEDDTPTSGEITISVDETFKPVVETQLDTFHKLYTYAKINVQYKSEGEAVKDLLSDSARLIIIPRKLTKDELSYFENQKIVPTMRRVCYDAIAVIMNNANTDSLLTMQKFRDIMSGKITSWQQVSGKSGLGSIQVVFDNTNSSTVRYVREQIGNVPLTKNSYAVNNNASVVDYVAKNRNSIGFIGVNWISGRHESTTSDFLSRVRVAGLAADSIQVPSIDDYRKPYQAYIHQKTYPLTREVYMLTGEARAGLGNGLIAFIASDRGQRIFLKSGLVPATAPVRLVEINKDQFKITK